MKKILLDTNKIINILNGNHEDIEYFKEQYKHNNVIFFTTPLIRHEVLRYYTYTDKSKYENAEKFLSELEIINIDRDITDIATDIVRYERTKYPERYQPKSDGTEKRLDKYNFDTIYVSTAKCFELDMPSNDGDISKILSLYDEMISYKKAAF